MPGKTDFSWYRSKNK